MKLIHLKNLKRECVLVELPSMYSEIVMGGKTNLDFGGGIKSNKCLGRFRDLKDEDFEGLVKCHATLHLYKDYNTDKQNPTNVFTKRTPSESFISAIEAEGWYIDINHTRHVEPDFNEAQEKVINLSNCYLFVKS